ncbi:hypothetical protein [Lysinibacillus sp. 54212]|uniref:hypothetical protein n=1 Tax=Lysinibacillus sp. 54212 TaxID=3119829 RepID=UPI002FC9EE2C
MDKELQRLQAPGRSNQTKQSSFCELQKKINTRKRQQKRNYYSVLVATAVLLIFIATSMMNSPAMIEENDTAASLHIEKGYAINMDAAIDVRYMTKWYYFDKNKVSEYELGTVQPFLTKLFASNVRMKELPQLREEQLLLEMSNGQILQLALLYEDAKDQYILANINTKQALPLTMEEAKQIEFIIYNFAKKSYLGVVKLFLMILSLIAYLLVIMQISPKRKEKLESKKASYYVPVVFGTYVLYTIVAGISLYNFHSYNGLFIASIMTSLFIMKALGEYYNGRFERSLFEVPIFFVFVLLLTFVKCL